MLSTLELRHLVEQTFLPTAANVLSTRLQR